MDDLVRAAAQTLADGGLVALPTETVYGLAADASNPDALARVFAVKGRPLGHPLIVHVGNAEDLDRWAREVPPLARTLVEAFWPGPLTVLVPRSAAVPDIVTGGRDTVALRMPDHPLTLAVLGAFGGGVAAPSANRFGHVSPTTAAHVLADLGDDVDLIVDGGPCGVGVESTIVDCTGHQPEIVRMGGVSVEAIRAVVGFDVAVWAGAGEARAPGMLASHYAPHARVEVGEVDTVVSRAAELVASGAVVGVLAPSVVDGLSPDVVELEPAGGADNYARVLYDRLRQADRLGFDVLLAVPPAPVGLGAAVADRLRRAATPR
jgi:L-threonylcarbamoyladenylate synthase